MNFITRNGLTAAFIAASGVFALVAAPAALAQNNFSAAASSANASNAPATAGTSGVRIAFVNTDRLLRESNPAKVAQAKLEQEFSKREKDIDDADAALKTATDNFQRDMPTLSDSQRQQRQRQLADMDRDLQRKKGEFQDDLNARKQEELQQILDRANRVVKQIAESQHYDVILQEAVYANQRLDITDQVIQALNAPAK
ncbi:MAG: OmpH family outer membrane protein [Burkholderiaceae bacterium]|jgi:outer membrane protein|nr:OmpH family outer membrane protein [Burkholderiaceae bacterium]